MPEKCWILKSFLKNFQFTHFFRLTYYHWAVLFVSSDFFGLCINIIHPANRIF